MALIEEIAGSIAHSVREERFAVVARGMPFNSSSVGLAVITCPSRSRTVAKILESSQSAVEIKFALIEDTFAEEACIVLVEILFTFKLEMFASKNKGVSLFAYVLFGNRLILNRC